LLGFSAARVPNLAAFIVAGVESGNTGKREACAITLPSLAHDWCGVSRAI
jgi:hypothetical protein